MKTPKHTSAPWLRVGDHTIASVDTHGNRKLICKVLVRDTTAEETEANEKLLSASLDMADVLELIADRVTLSSGERAAVDAALMKAGRLDPINPARALWGL